MPVKELSRNRIIVNGLTYKFLKSIFPRKNESLDDFEKRSLKTQENSRVAYMPSKTYMLTVSENGITIQKNIFIECT